MKYISLLFVFLVIILVLILVKNTVTLRKSEESPLEISINEAKARRFGFIVDVQTPEQRKKLGYYPNSVPIALEKLDTQVPLDISNKKTWILVYSNGDQRARVAAEKLYEKGYPNVRYIQGSYLRLMPGSQ